MLGNDAETVLKKEPVFSDFLPGSEYPYLWEAVLDEK